MDTVGPKELLDLLAEWNGMWQQYWNVLYTVAAAMVTLVASIKTDPRFRRILSATAAVGFLLFAAGNYMALYEMRMQRENVVAFVEAKAGSNPQVAAVAKAAEPPSLPRLDLYHWGLCAFVVVLLFAVPEFRARSDS